ncbi:MFS permease [Rubellimicrobium mesophilum DSM 19309]|uniref:MFS permease n=1 Tax=Rubellimicrobium mesophilum DSM 19309 TaxID=442562 RepID=A0A017HMP8_9RHOB|nr:MFS transporter [Rubellimicrobium mesophilum]EYD75641.1 MFS permease [Rubellimicrobium mesophilum DSM 19309]
MAETRAEAPPRSAVLAPLRHPVFRALWLASLASNFGGLIQSVGASWLMTSIAPQASMVALVQASATLPIMLLSLFSGAVADNFDRRRVMLTAQAFMLVVSALLTIVAWIGFMTPWLLLLFTFLIGCGTALNNPAWQASVGDMVPRGDLPAAVGLNSMGFNIARSVGPALGGAIVALAGAAAAFAINAVSYVGLIAVLTRWRPEPTVATLPPEPLGAAMLAGPRYVALSPAVRVVLLRAFVFGMGASAVNALMPLIARELVGGGPLTYGLLLGAFGVGAVAGALVSTRLRARLSTEKLVRVSSLGFAAGAATAGLSGFLPLTLGALLLTGAGWVLALSSFNVTVQMSTPRWVVARALSLYQMAAFGGLAGGSWLWGTVAEGQGLRVALLSAGAVLVGCTLIGFVRPLADAEGRDLGPLRSWAAPETAVPVDGRTGPVVVAVEWHVAEADLPEFLGVMAERRRIRRRDGAHNWMLLRDLADPSLWVERYHAPTWHDYQRLNTRLTRDDAEVFETLRRLHRGAWPPQVRRMIEREARPWTRDPGRVARELATPLADPSRNA